MAGDDRATIHGDVRQGGFPLAFQGFQFSRIGFGVCGEIIAMPRQSFAETFGDVGDVDLSRIK
jgi:hypothetical protein